MQAKQIIERYTEEMDLFSLFSLIWRRKWTLIICVVLMCGAGAAYTTSDKIYLVRFDGSVGFKKYGDNVTRRKIIDQLGTGWDVVGATTYKLTTLDESVLELSERDIEERLNLLKPELIKEASDIINIINNRLPTKLHETDQAVIRLIRSHQIVDYLSKEDSLVLDVANLNIRELSPQKNLVIGMSLFIGIMFGIFVAIFAEALMLIRNEKTKTE